MTLIAAFIVNAILSFAIGLVIAAALGPSEFGLYALAVSLVTVLSTVLFEGLRLATLRFYSNRTRSEKPAIRATLDAGYGLIALLTVILTGLVLVSGIEFSGLSPWVLVAAGATLLGQALFEYHGALARARFEQRTYVQLIAVKNFAALVLVVGACFYFQSAAAALAAVAVSALIGTAVARRPLRDAGVRLRLASSKIARKFLIYAAPLVIANTVYSLIELMNRSWLMASYGSAETGQFSLAWELGLRIFVIAGSALDILLFQLAVRADEYDGRAAGEHQLSRNAATLIVLLLPLAAGLWVCLPAIEALIIPVTYHESFVHYSMLMIPVFLAFALVQFALNPVFQLRERTAPVIAAAVIGLVMNGGALFVLPHWYGPSGVVLAQLAGMIAALGVLGYLTLVGQDPIRLPWRDIALSFLATAVMIVTIWPLQAIGSPLVRLIATVMLGLGIYGGFVWFMDLASLRTIAWSGIERMRSRRPRPSVPHLF